MGLRSICAALAATMMMLILSCAGSSGGAPPEASIQEQHPIAADDSPTTPALRVTSLEQAIETAWRHNPSLRADHARFEAMLQDAPQARSLPDPMFSLARMAEAGTFSATDGETMGELMQTFPWFGKRDTRGRIADRAAREMFEEYRANLLDVRRGITAAWHELAYEQGALELARENRAIARQMVEAVSALYISGDANRQALLRAEAEVARIDTEIATIPGRIETRSHELKRLMGTGALAGPEPMASMRDNAPVPPVEDLLAAAMEHRPELRRYDFAAEGARLSGRLARLDYYPDFTAGVRYSWMNESGGGMGGDPDDEWGASVGINIPIPNARRRAARIQAERREEEAELRRLAVEQDIDARIGALLPALTALERQRAILRTQLIPLAEETFASALTDYQSARATSLDLLDAQRALVSIRNDLLRADRDYLVLLADLERAVGTPLHHLNDTPER